VIGITECYGDSWLTPFRGQRCTRELAAQREPRPCARRLARACRPVLAILLGAPNAILISEIVLGGERTQNILVELNQLFR
jgi:hypothetical protein